MLYIEFIQKAKELTIEQHENNIWYLQPEWKFVLFTNGLNSLKFRDFRTDWETVEDNLKLEVEKRNKRNNKLNGVIEWIDETINTTVEPAMLEEENALVANALEFMRMNHKNEANDG